MQSQQWLAELSGGAIRSRGSYCAPRRLLMPERLEHRNAPSALLPLLTMLSSASEFESSENYAFQETERRGLAYYYQSPATTDSHDIDFLMQQVFDAWQVEESTRQEWSVQQPLKLETFESRIPQDLVALNAVFASLGENPTEEPPRVIQPVEPGPEPEPLAVQQPMQGPNSSVIPSESTVDAPNEASDSLPVDFISEPPTVESPSNPVIDLSEKQHTSPDVPNDSIADAPPVIQPVITDPESEHNQPSSEFVV